MRAELIVDRSSVTCEDTANGNMSALMTIIGAKNHTKARLNPTHHEGLLWCRLRIPRNYSRFGGGLRRISQHIQSPSQQKISPFSTGPTRLQVPCNIARQQSSKTIRCNLELQIRDPRCCPDSLAARSAQLQPPGGT